MVFGSLVALAFLACLIRLFAAASVLGLLINLMYLAYIRKIEGAVGPYAPELNKAIIWQSMSLFIINIALIIAAVKPEVFCNGTKDCKLDTLLTVTQNAVGQYCSSALPADSKWDITDCFNSDPDDYNASNATVCVQFFSDPSVTTTA
jgi:hypothetical protein